VAAAILGVVVVAGFFAAPGGEGGLVSPAYLVDASALILAFWFPAMHLEAPGDLVRRWRPLVLWLLSWTLVWDLGTAGVMRRSVLDEWWLVYPSGVVVLGALLGLHAFIVQRLAARRAGPRGSS
jgi:hypothetical protein